MPIPDTISIQAKLTLLTTDEGGRQTFIKTGYRPNHVFEYLSDGRFQNTYIGEIRFNNIKEILPGETAIVTVCFLNHEDLEKYLQIGQKWYIHEGPRLLGHAEIISL